MALDHNAVVTELWRRINEALTIPLQTAATAASDALLAQIAAEAARDGTAAMLEESYDTQQASFTLNYEVTSSTHGYAVATNRPRFMAGQNIWQVMLNPGSWRIRVTRKTDGDTARIRIMYNGGSSHYMDADATVMDVDYTFSDKGHILFGLPGEGSVPVGTKYAVDYFQYDPLKADIGHKHTSAEITDASHYTNGSSYAGRLVKFSDSDGQIHYGAAPNDPNHVANKKYVDQEVDEKADTEHMHVTADIADLPKISTVSSDYMSIVQRTREGNIDVPATPIGRRNAASKGYVDREVGKKADADHMHVSADITDASSNSNLSSAVGKLVHWDSGGRIQTVDPVGDANPATKNYVDTELKKKAPLEHRHTSEQIDGLDETLNTAMTTKADITYVDDELSKQTHVLEEITDYPGHDTSNTPSTLIRRNSTGLASISYPRNSEHIANKGYVDERIQLVTSWPSNPVSGVLYLMEED